MRGITLPILCVVAMICIAYAGMYEPKEVKVKSIPNTVKKEEHVLIIDTCTHVLVPQIVKKKHVYREKVHKVINFTTIGQTGGQTGAIIINN